MSLLVPYLCGLKMNRFHEKFYKKNRWQMTRAATAEVWHAKCMLKRRASTLYLVCGAPASKYK